MKLLRIIKVLMKPRPMIGIVTLVFAVIVASVQGVSLWWSIPAGLWFAETAGFIYERIEKERKATPAP